MGRSDEEKRGQVLDLLLFSLCSDTFNAMGVPIRKLNSLRACQNLCDEWTNIDSANIAELTRMYQDMGLPPNGLKKEDLVDRLKKISLWMALPFSDLQRECRSHHVNSIGAEKERAEMVGRLMGVCWLPQDQPKSEPQPLSSTRSQTQGCNSKYSLPPRKSCPVASTFEKLTAHLRVLELPASAGVDDIKRAYRRLALKYHPDKNHGTQQDYSAQQFRRISEAYAIAM